MARRWAQCVAITFTTILLSLAWPAKAATLNVSFSSIATGTDVNLSQEGALDWVHWGLITESSVDRKSGVTPQISDFSVVYNPVSYAYVYQYADNFNGYSWNDGTPHMSVTNTKTGVWTYGTPPPPTGSGFRFTVPASTNLQTLKVYVGAFAGRGRFVATLNDTPAVGYTNSSNQAVDNVSNGPSAVYAVSFAAGSAGKTLTITYTLEQPQAGPNMASANVTLQAAALTAAGANNIPFVALTSPADGTSVLAPTNLTLTATANDNDGTVTLIEFYNGQTKLGDVVPPANSFTWTNPPAGRHTLTARAIDNSAGVGASLPVTVFVATNGGTLSGSRATAPTSLNLTAEGTSDWAHWGLLNPSNFHHRAGGGGQISSFTPLGTNAVKRLADNRTAFSWSDGTPVTAVANSNVAVFISEVTNGFEFSAPADTNLRTLRVYAGLYGAQGKFEAWLTDFSGHAYTDLSLSNVFGNSYATYALNYAAASPNQRLVVRYTVENLFDFDFGNVTLAAATLQGPPPPAPLRLQNPAKEPNQFYFSFPSTAGQSYTIQFTPALWPTNWQTLTNVPGKGGTMNVTDYVGSASQRFYRLFSP
jgi:hypothetical protein